MYEIAEVIHDKNGAFNTIKFSNFDTQNLLYDSSNNLHSILEIVDKDSIIVEVEIAIQCFEARERQGVKVVVSYGKIAQDLCQRREVANQTQAILQREGFVDGFKRIEIQSIQERVVVYGYIFLNDLEEWKGDVGEIGIVIDGESTSQRSEFRHLKCGKYIVVDNADKFGYRCQIGERDAV